ncbi:hypothetical protein [Mycobacterium simulans]|uniref:hypothetical protein n=1 Tax=Mycobacterium simulans TaxID=627089 RepID=UPI0016410203|nr:hypothetical protein [Mycobacterium simulans]
MRSFVDHRRALTPKGLGAGADRFAAAQLADELERVELQLNTSGPETAEWLLASPIHAPKSPKS